MLNYKVNYKGKNRGKNMYRIIREATVVVAAGRGEVYIRRG
jgi:hypothetical protein